MSDLVMSPFEFAGLAEVFANGLLAIGSSADEPKPAGVTFTWALKAGVSVDTEGFAKTLDMVIGDDIRKKTRKPFSFSVNACDRWVSFSFRWEPIAAGGEGAA